ncbi:recombinase family protein [Yersinia enterocolitica]|uniref:Recombinase n=2 Tax=Yersinia TaxID=629 RepID=A0AA36LMX3_YERMO|nr:recombinase family protein [Yersinia mollaretii]ELI8002939.1 recombinase family protein [Yersinia enterocolitica]ELZ9066481.1 recombinase family protein [Yersinia enterocolitica]MBW5811341.1 recombinase family protein [Yersinia kristensenii]CNH78124.1 Recombinase [Yersinia mollaretii]
MRTKMAYCYCRVSSGHQTTEKGGYGMSRQQGMLMDYVDEYSDSDGLGYGLSSESVVFLNAEGVSGFSGANLAKGSVLLAFIEDVKAEKIKNAVLCIENIDRFSRTNPQTAALSFLQLIEAGCNIHEAENGIVHHKNSDLNLISSGLIRSHRESLRKQKLSLKNWDKRFDNVVKKEAVLTARCPSWLYVEDNKYLEVIEHTKSIRLIFDLYIKGFGQAYIRDELNSRQWLYNGKTWGSWNVHRVLNDVRVTGKHRTQSDLRKDFDGLVIYPAIISEMDFNSVQQKLKSPGRSKKINRRANNLFSGLLMCGHCKKAHILLQVDKDKRFGRCSYAIAGNNRCHARGFKYEIIENALIEHLRHFEMQSLDEGEHNLELQKLQDEFIYYKNYGAEVQSIVDSVDIPNERDYRILKNIESKVREIEGRIDEIKVADNIADEFGKIVETITSDLKDVNNISMRQEFNCRLRKIIKSISVFRNSEIILLSIDYYACKDYQWININPKTGELQGNLYVEGDKIVIHTKTGDVSYNTIDREYSFIETSINEDEVLEILQK